jgi:hypothetical protein
MTHSYPFQSRSPIIARVVEGNSDWRAHANKPKDRKAMKLEYLDRPTPGWKAIDVFPAKSRGWDWVALMIDVDPKALQDHYRPGGRVPQQRWMRIRGKHRKRDRAYRALEEMTQIRQ